MEQEQKMQAGLNQSPTMSPALKRFIKVLVFGAIGGGLAAALGFINSNPVIFGSWTVLIASVIGFIEKSIPNNF